MNSKIEDGNEDDCKPAAKIKSQDDDDVSDSEEEPSKKNMLEAFKTLSLRINTFQLQFSVAKGFLLFYL